MRVCRVLAVVGLIAASLVGTTVTTSFAATTTIAPGHVTVTYHKVVGGFSSPVYVTSARDGSHRLFVVEQAGKVRVVKNGAIQSTAYLNLTSRVLSGGEQGMLSVAF